MKSSFFKHPVVSGIIVLALSLTANGIATYYLNKPFFVYIFILIHFIWNSIISILTFKISIWTIIIITFIFYIISRFIKKKKTVVVVKPPKYIEYRRKLLKGILWKWDYDSKFQITNVRPCCINDENILVQGMSGYICPLCDKHYAYPINDSFISNSSQVINMTNVIAQHINILFDLT